METWALVAHDDQTFMAKVVNLGVEKGVLTRDRVDEIIRVSVAMANKYVLQKEVDFRAEEELAKVQETILKLVGIGLEVRSKGSMEEGVSLLMDASPVELFRLAYTRIERLRHRWKLLLEDHRVEILVSAEEFRALSDVTGQRLAELSVFTESELYTIRSLTMDDAMFTTLGVLEYYESELERYEFLLRMKRILPFGLLNRSSKVRADHLSEVDSIREALINTILISAFVEAEDPVAITMADVRTFLARLDVESGNEILTEELEEVVIEVIQELGEGLDERDAAFLTRETVDATRKLMETIVSEWETVNSSSQATFFKRWSRMAIICDAPDPIERVLTSEDTVDEFDFEMLSERIALLRDKDVDLLIQHLPWQRMTPQQITTLCHRFPAHQEALARHVSLSGFKGEDIVDFLDGLSPEAAAVLMPTLEEAVSTVQFTLEELELLVAPPNQQLLNLLWKAHPPSDMRAKRILREFRDGSVTRRQVILSSCLGADFFPVVFAEAWAIDPALVKRQVKAMPVTELGRFFLAADRGRMPEKVQAGTRAPEPAFHSKELNSLFKSLPATKKKSLLTFFSQD